MKHLSLITFNCFGVPGPVTGRRLRALTEILNAADAHIVCLQEVQAHPYRTLITRTSTTYPFSAFAPHLHAPRGGLLTLARSAFEYTQFTDYRDRGLWYSPALADVALAKGILATCQTIDGMEVVVLNTHLSANYRGDWEGDNAYRRTEERQLAQLAEVVAAQSSEALVVVCGDFNVPRNSTMFAAFLAKSGLVDPLSGDERPTYRPLPGIPARYALPIDFTLVRPPASANIELKNEIRFGERVTFPGGGGGFLSDHLGLELRVNWQ